MNTELMQAFDFTADDLPYNRTGALSPRQLNKFKASNTRSGIFAFIIMLGFGVGAYFTLSPFWAEKLVIADNLGRLIGGIVLTVISLFFLFTLFENVQPTIKSARGKVQFVVKESDTPHEDGTVTTSTTHYVVIGNEYFPVDKKQYQYLKQGHIYTFYKEVSVLGRVISVEYVGPPEN